MSSFQEFPKMMVHPAHQPAVPNKFFPLKYRPQPGEVETAGSPERFPAVTVNNEDQQEYYESKGYRVEGTTDASAFDHAASGGTPASYAFNEYPKMVQTIDQDGDKIDVVVHSKEEEGRMLGYNPVDMKEEPEVIPKPKNKGGRPKGSGKKPVSDKMSVSD